MEEQFWYSVTLINRIFVKYNIILHNISITYVYIYIYITNIDLQYVIYESKNKNYYLVNIILARKRITSRSKSLILWILLYDILLF